MQRLSWGRTKSGRSYVPLGIVGGAPLGAAFGLLYWLLNRADPQAWMEAIALAVVTAPIGFAFLAMFLVERRTMKGAVDRPEQSVEFAWFHEAASWAFFVVMIAVSLFQLVAGIVPSLRGLVLHRDWLWTVVLLGWGTLGVAYLAIKRRES